MNMNPFELFRNMDKIKEQAAELKAKMSQMKSTGYAMGNMIEVVVNGDMQVESLKIDPSLVKEGNDQMLSVLVASAVNNAMSNMRDRVGQETGQALAQYGVNL